QIRPSTFRLATSAFAGYESRLKATRLCWSYSIPASFITIGQAPWSTGSTRHKRGPFGKLCVSGSASLPSGMDYHIHSLAEKIWDYHRMKQQVDKADVILVLCSHDRKVAERGAELFLEQWAPLLIFSGGLGSITRDIWTEPEADQFAKIAIAMGVPQKRILIENRSTNTGENILFTKK